MTGTTWGAEGAAGRYGCGCRVRLSKAYPASRFVAPFCIRHGHGLGAWTAVRHRTASFARGLWSRLRFRGPS